MSPSPTNTSSDPNLLDESCKAVSGSGITKDFVQKALTAEARRNGWPVPEILSCKVEEGTKPGDNYMSLIFSADVELKNSPRNKRHLLIKCYPNHPIRQVFTNKCNVFFKELETYKTWHPELKRLQTEVAKVKAGQEVDLPYAPFVYGECIDFTSPEGEAMVSKTLDSLDNYIIMEDVRSLGYRMTSRREPMDIDHVRLAVVALAKVHALSWAYGQLVEPNIAGKYPWLTTLKYSDEDIESWKMMLYSNIATAISVLDAEFGKGNKHSNALGNYRTNLNDVLDAVLGNRTNAGMESLFRTKPDPAKFGKLEDNAVEWTIISHGDCWSNNMLFKYDPVSKKPTSIILVDLQLSQETCVVNDLLYFIYASTDRALRDTHMDSLLELYHDTFSEICGLLGVPTLPGFSLPSLKYRFHRGKLIGFFYTMMLLPIILKDEGEAVNLEEVAVEEGKDIGDLFNQVSSGFEKNDTFKHRLIGVTEELLEAGVF